MSINYIYILMKDTHEVKDSWFVSPYTHVPAKKIVDPLVGGGGADNGRRICIEVRL